VRRRSSALVWAALGGLAGAQAPGSQLRSVELVDFQLTKAQSFDDFLGRTVLLEFFAHWCGPCGAQVPHLNEIHETWSDQGLSIVAVTSTREDRAKTQAWIEGRGVGYAVAMDPDGQLASWFGIRGIPHSVLVAPDGKILWRGHPAELSEERLKEAVAGALAKPLWDYPEVHAELSKGRYAAALAAADRLGAEVPIAKLLRERIAAKLAAVERARAAGDYLTAQEQSEKVAAELAGLPEAVTAAEILTALAQDEAVQKVITGQIQLRELAPMVDQVRTLKAAEELKAKLETVRASYPGTFVEAQAKRAIERLQQRMG
jgi:thiol-disulfide isomerase/thioredoxin